MIFCFGQVPLLFSVRAKLKLFCKKTTSYIFAKFIQLKYALLTNYIYMFSLSCKTHLLDF